MNYKCRIMQQTELQIITEVLIFHLLHISGRSTMAINRQAHFVNVASVAFNKK